MANAIDRVCVIGAGVMGAGIAAQVANAGVKVLLLDILPKDGGGKRDAVAAGAVAKMLRTEPAPFMSKAAAKLVETGNIEDDLERVAACDWVIEAIIERVDLKQDLYRRLDAVRRPGTAISSNTSTIPLAKLIAGLPERFARDFTITHFFNPPRYMRLLEVVTHPGNDTAMVDAIRDFADLRLGKTVVMCRDTPGFIANRIGTLWMQQAINRAADDGLTIEEADAVMGKPFGFPKTGVFGLLDLVGIDLMPHINASMKALLPADDLFVTALRDQPLLSKMIADGYTGRKGLGGFYRINKAAGKIRESIGLVSGEYQPSQKVTLPSATSRSAKSLVASTDRYGKFAWDVMSATLAYAAGLVGEIADDIVAIDDAMRLGFAWKFGPFELLDQLGPKAVADRLRAEGRTVPAILDLVGAGSFYRVEAGRLDYLGLDGAYHPRPRAEGVLLLEDIRRAGKPVERNGSAALWDIGQGVLCLEFTGKMNTLDEHVIKMAMRAREIIEGGDAYRALVIYSEAKDFSLGANLGLTLFACNIAAWSEIDKLIASGQTAMKALKYAPFPVVAAPAGMALGGGCEIALHADAIQAHAETYMGLVECGVGLIPGWGGCGELIDRWQKLPTAPKGPMPAPSKAFEAISTARVAKSAEEAREMQLLRPGDGITMNRDRLLFDARARAIALLDGYAAPPPPTFRLPGPSGQLAFAQAVDGFRRLGIASPHDVTVAAALAETLCGGDADILDELSETQVLEIERRNFLKLIKTGPTLARIEHTLVTGKPLRN